MREEHSQKYHPHKPKRLIFAEEIRKRSRNEKISQIRNDNAIREKVWSYLATGQQQIDTLGLYTLMQQQKINQSNGAKVLGEWLLTENPSVQISSRRQCLHWVYFLSSILQYNSHLVQLIIQKYFDAVLQFCITIKDLQLVYTLLCVIFNLIESNIVNPNLEILTLKFQKVNCTQIDLRRQSNIKINQLKYYKKLLNNYPHQVFKLGLSQDFLPRMVNFLETSLQSTEQINEIIKILVPITYFDKEENPELTQKLIELNLLYQIKFILQFMETNIHKQLVSNCLILVVNIISNIGVQQIIDEGIWDQVWGIIANHCSTNSTYNLVIKNACKCYLTIIQNIPNQQNILTQIRNNQSIENIIALVQKFSNIDQQILIQSSYALKNLLIIGQQIQQCDNSIQVNPYAYAIKYADDFQCLKQYQMIWNVLQEYFC